jgi:hypothetical protein
MTQYSLKKGLKKFKGNAEEAVSKELMQIHLKYNLTPQDGGELMEAQNKGAMGLFMFLKEKRMVCSNYECVQMVANNLRELPNMMLRPQLCPLKQSWSHLISMPWREWVSP